jgi:PQQ-dependent catabolism-associated CXXCW motif protein
VWTAFVIPVAAATEPPAGAPTEAAQIPEEPADYWTGPINGPVPKSITGGTVISTAELRSLLERGDIVLIEVSNAPRRPEQLAPGAPWLPKPHVIIPGSVWVPGAGMGEIAPEVDSKFRERLANATARDFDRQIVIYCHERCWLSWNAAKRAIRYGYRSVHWYAEGIEGWRAAGLETAVSDEPAG